MHPSKYCYLSVIISFVHDFLNLKFCANNIFVDIKSSNLYYLLM